MKHAIDVHVGKRLRSRRTMMGFSQSDLAKAVGITFQQVQKYENGANAMNVGRLYDFAHFLRVPITYFFDDLERAEPLSPDNDRQHAPHTFGSDRESLEIMKAFKCIKSHTVRKRAADLFRVLADIP